WTAVKRAALSQRSLPCTTDWDFPARWDKKCGSAVRGPRTVRASVSVDGGGGGGTDRTGEELGDVDDFERVRGVAWALFRGDGVAEHDQAVPAGSGDGVGVQGEGFLDPLGVDPLADSLFHPHPGAAGAA